MKRRAVATLQFQFLMALFFVAFYAQEKSGPAVLIGMSNERGKTPFLEIAAFSPQQLCAGKVELGDQAVGREREVADRREVVQFGVAGQRRFEFGTGLTQLLVLHFQLDLMHLQFVQQSQLIGLGRGGCRRLCHRPRLQTRFSVGAQTVGIIRLGHDDSFAVLASTRSCASRRLARPMSLIVTTTPSMTFSRVR